MAARKRARRREPDTMVASIGDVDVVLELAGGKVSTVTLPLDQNGALKVPASFLRGIVDLLDDVDHG